VNGEFEMFDNLLGSFSDFTELKEIKTKLLYLLGDVWSNKEDDNNTSDEEDDNNTSDDEEDDDGTSDEEDDDNISNEEVDDLTVFISVLVEF